MSFVYDNSSLNGAKVNRGPLPGGEDPNKWIQANEDWNPTIAAIYDLRTGILDNLFFGIGRQVVAPTVPVSAALDYLWANNSGDLFWHKNGSGNQQLNGGTGGASSVFFWDGATTWDTLWAQILLAGSAGLVLIPPGSSRTITTFGSPYDFSNIRFMCIGPFRSILNIASGVHLDGGAIAMLDVENLFVEASTALMTSTTKDVWLRGRRSIIENTGAAVLFTTSSSDIYIQLEMSSLDKSGAAAILHMSDAAARVVIEATAGSFPQNLPVIATANTITGVAGSHVAVITDPLSSPDIFKGIGSGIVIEALGNQFGQLGFPRLATVDLPTPSLFNKGQVTYDTTASVPKYSDGAAWQTFASAAGETLQQAYNAGRLITMTNTSSPIEMRVGDNGPWIDFKDAAGNTLALAKNWGAGAGAKKQFGIFDANGANGFWLDDVQLSHFGPANYALMDSTGYELGTYVNVGNQLRVNITYSWMRGPNGVAGVQAQATNLVLRANSVDSITVDGTNLTSTVHGIFQDTTVATGQVAAMSLQNPTAATVGAQKFSPMLVLEGHGWKTNATAGSQTIDWALQSRPVQGAANPDADLVFWSNINGAGYVEKVKFSNAAVGPSMTVAGMVLENLAAFGSPQIRGVAANGYMTLSSDGNGTFYGGTGITMKQEAVPANSILHLTVNDFPVLAMQNLSIAQDQIQPRTNGGANTLDIGGVANTSGLRRLWYQIGRQSVGGALTVSSNTIAPDSQIHAVSAGLIKNITLPFTGFTGTLRFYSLAGNTYDATGNITGTGTIGAGQIFEATYSGTTWFIGLLPSTTPGGAQTFATLYSATSNDNIVPVDSTGNSVRFSRSNTGTGQLAGAALINSTAATVGAQKFSPGLELTGNGWRTGSGGASEAVGWMMQVRPVQGVADPDAELVFWNSINGSSYAEVLKMSPTDGTLQGLNSGRILFNKTSYGIVIDATSSTIAIGLTNNGTFAIGNTSLSVTHNVGSWLGATNGYFQNLSQISNVFKNVNSGTPAPSLIADTNYAAGTNSIFQVANNTVVKFEVLGDGVPKWTNSSNAQTTVGAAGGASALPATPTKYLKVQDSTGTTYVFPVYAP